jgi:outer membrane lipoprotein LolB
MGPGNDAVRALALTPLFLLLITVVTGCALPVPRPADPVLEQRWSEHLKAVEQIQSWDLRARFAVRSDEQGGQATLSWQRAPGRQSIQLNGPLGRGVVRIVQDAQGARLTDAERREFSAASAEELLRLYTGWQLPVANLDWWARGLPVPGSGARRELDEQGRLRVLRQQGWEISYSDYVQVESVGLPSRFTLARAATEFAPELEVRFVIERWAGVK